MCLLDLLAEFTRARPGWSPRVLLGDDGPLRGAVSGLGVPCDVVPMPASLAGLGDAGLGMKAGSRGAAARALATRGAAALAAAGGYLADLRKRLRAEAPDVLQT